MNAFSICETGKHSYAESGYWGEKDLFREVIKRTHTPEPAMVMCDVRTEMTGVTKATGENGTMCEMATVRIGAETVRKCE